MKKAISEAKVQRMRNLITKKYGNKTQIRSGYTKQEQERKEGDIWIEKGRKWTIKNGIKRNVTKLNSARAKFAIPLCCPKCNGKMQHQAHKHTFKRWGICFICTSKWEQEMIIDGTYEEFIKEINDKNFDIWIKDVTQEYYDWLNKRKSQAYVTEAGDIEDWSGGETSDKLKEEFDAQVQKIKDCRNENK
tara:strand:- start:780 stop:1349 length:570 start_codon:yes stop_codon:yes gene_type:complete